MTLYFKISLCIYFTNLTAQSLHARTPPTSIIKTIYKFIRVGPPSVVCRSHPLPPTLPAHPDPSLPQPGSQPTELQASQVKNKVSLLFKTLTDLTASPRPRYLKALKCRYFSIVQGAYKVFMKDLQWSHIC